MCGHAGYIQLFGNSEWFIKTLCSGVSVAIPQLQETFAVFIIR